MRARVEKLDMLSWNQSEGTGYKKYYFDEIYGLSVVRCHKIKLRVKKTRSGVSLGCKVTVSIITG